MKSWTRSVLMLAVVGGCALAGGALAQTAISEVSFARVQKEVVDAKQNLASVQDLSTVFKTVSRAVEPSVVSIETRSVVPAVGGIERFLPPDMAGPDQGGGGGGGGMAMGTGSGVILEVSGDGAFILTNNHVVANANSVKVTLSDGRIIPDAKVVGTDPRTDLAVVRIRADKLIAANWGESTGLEKGDWVLAFGSPFGYVGSMTAGIVSALNRQVGILGNLGVEDFIQVDAAINPGNSGGPLVNTRGEVIGINTAIASRTGSFNGLGFAVPSKIARPVFETLKTDGKVQRGYLGVQIADVSDQDERTRNVVAATGFKGQSGVFVGEVGRDAPAFGVLQPGDIITVIEGKEVRSMKDLRERVAATKPGTALKMRVFREGKDADVEVKVGEQPDAMAAFRGSPGQRNEPRQSAGEFVQGLTLRNFNENVGRRIGVEGVENGAVIEEVVPGSAPFNAGLRQGDVITRVNGKPVATAAEAAEVLRAADATKGVRLNVTNSQGSRFVMITPR